MYSYSALQAQVAHRWMSFCFTEIYQVKKNYKKTWPI
jgi:hypothetical protein